MNILKSACCLLSFILFAQNIFAQSNEADSLQQQLRLAKNDPDRLAILQLMHTAAFNTDISKALDFALQGIALAEKTNDKKWQPVFYEAAGRMHANMLHLDTAVQYFNKAMAGYVAVKDKRGEATTLFKMAWVHRQKQEIEMAMADDLKALKIMEALNDATGIADALGRVSDDLSRQGRQKEALDYALRAVALCEKNGMEKELVTNMLIAGNASLAMEDKTGALNWYDKAIAAAEKGKADIIRMSDLRNSRGNALKKLGRYQEALIEYKKAQELAIKANYTNAINTVIANLGEINMILENYPEALKYQQQTVARMEADDNRANLVENYLHLSNTYEKLNNLPAALEYQKKARLLRDSTASKESDEAMSELLTKYEADKKQATITAQQSQLSSQRRVQWLTAGALGLLAILLLVGYRSYRARTKSNTLLAAKNAENELLLKEIHHRVKNNLEVVSSLLELQGSQVADEHTREAMLESQHRVHSIGIVHQKLYQRETLGAIEMKDYFINLGESILDSFGASTKVVISCVMDKLDIDIDTAVPLGLIVNELLTNAIKYAFPDDRAGKVEIKLEKKSSGLLQLQVSDNGIGKTGLTQGTGFGGQLVSLLTRQLNGSMREENKDGTHIFFEFKMGKAA